MKLRFAFLAAAALTTITAQARAETYQYASAFSANDAFTHLVEQWAANVSKDTGGGVAFEVVPNGALVPLPETLDAIGQGVVPAGMVVASFTAGTIPAMGYAEMLGGVPAGKGSTSEALKQIWPDLQALFAEHGVRALWGAPAFSSGMSCREGFLKNPEDWKGRKIRTAGRWQAQQAVIMGALPVPMPPSELYVALQNGVVDCAFTTPSIAISMRLHEVAPYFTNTGLASNITISLFNLDTWNSLSDEQKAAIDRDSAEMLQTASTAMRDTADAGLVDMGKLGKVYSLTDDERKEVMKRAEPLFEAITKLAPTGPGASMIAKLSEFRK